jgi:hypothetical protein
MALMSNGTMPSCSDPVNHLNCGCLTGTNGDDAGYVCPGSGGTDQVHFCC